MTKTQLRLALLRIDNVVQFCLKYELSRRTVMRLRTRYKGSEPTQRTIDRMKAALIEEGIIESGEDNTKRNNRRRADKPLPGRKRT